MFTSIPTEQTTAVTDLLLSIQSLVTLLIVRRHRAVHPVGYSVWMVVGVLIALLAGGVDSQSGLRVNLFWSFDNHGLFHLVQMLSVVFFQLGLVAYADGSTCTAERPVR